MNNCTNEEINKVEFFITNAIPEYKKAWNNKEEGTQKWIKVSKDQFNHLLKTPKYTTRVIWGHGDFGDCTFEVKFKIVKTSIFTEYYG